MSTSTLPDVSSPLGGGGPPSQPAQHSALARLSGWCHDRRWTVLLAWLGILIAANVIAQSVGTQISPAT